jgi:hypothetical protein
MDKPKPTRRKRAARPLMLVSIGIAALTYAGCENESIGNPKQPPDLSAEANDLKAPPDMTPADGSTQD